MRPYPDLLDDLQAGRLKAVTVSPDGRQIESAPCGLTVLAGSFNPLHTGHERLAAAAGSLLQRPSAFEISVLNVEKPPLSLRDLEERLRQFAGRHTVILTRARSFPEKSDLLPDTVFVIGYDTLVRLLDGSFYPPYRPEEDPKETGSAVLLALSRMRLNGCRLAVAGRLQDGQFRTLGDVAIPPGYEEMFIQIPESAFRQDISSTEIRRKGGRICG